MKGAGPGAGPSPGLGAVLGVWRLAFGPKSKRDNQRRKNLQTRNGYQQTDRPLVV